MNKNNKLLIIIKKNLLTEKRKVFHQKISSITNKKFIRENKHNYNDLNSLKEHNSNISSVNLNLSNNNTITVDPNTDKELIRNNNPENILKSINERMSNGKIIFKFAEMFNLLLIDHVEKS